MDLKAINKALQELVIKRNELHHTGYDNPKYDELEEQLHNMEDTFQDNFGEDMEEVLQEVHNKLCPDMDVLYPIAYLGKKYTISDKGVYSVDSSEGVFVEVDKYPGKETKLVLIPNPVRIALQIGKDKQEIVWPLDRK